MVLETGTERKEPLFWLSVFLLPASRQKEEWGRKQQKCRGMDEKWW